MPQFAYAARNRKGEKLEGAIEANDRRTALALLYFNPIWIARHLFFIYLFSGRYQAISWSIFGIALKSFLVNIPISLAGNYIIQNKIALKHRFWASATFSALMAVYYALSEVIFS